MLPPTGDLAESLRTVQIQDRATCSSASLQGSNTCLAQVTPPLPGSAQLSRDATAHGQRGQAGRHGDILPHQDPTPDSHPSSTIITELEAMQLHWQSQNSQRHYVWSRTIHLQRKWQDNSSPAELVAGSCPVAAVTNATLLQESSCLSENALSSKQDCGLSPNIFLGFIYSPGSPSLCKWSSFTWNELERITKQAKHLTQCSSSRNTSLHCYHCPQKSSTMHRLQGQTFWRREKVHSMPSKPETWFCSHYDLHVSQNQQTIYAISDKDLFHLDGT